MNEQKRQSSAAFFILEPVKEKFSFRHKSPNPYFCDPEQICLGLAEVAQLVRASDS